MSKKRIRRKNVGRKDKVIQISILVLIALVVAIAVILLGIPRSRQADRFYAVRQTHFNLSPSQAKDYFYGFIIPALSAARDDPEEIPSIRRYLQRICADKTKFSLIYSHEYDGTALCACRAIQKKSYIIFYIPRWIDFQRYQSPAEQKDRLVIATCHEVIHILFDPKPKPKDPAARFENEINAWFIMTKTVVRPMLKSGRYAGYLEMHAEEILTLSGDNYADPRFVEFIQSFCFNQK